MLLPLGLDAVVRQFATPHLQISSVIHFETADIISTLALLKLADSRGVSIRSYWWTLPLMALLAPIGQLLFAAAVWCASRGGGKRLKATAD